MRTFVSIAIALLSIGSFAFVTAAEGGPGGRGPGGRGPGGRGELTSPLVTAIDADGNGELSAAELAAAAEALKKLDKNGDGKVARDEYLPAFGPDRGGPPRQGAGDSAASLAGPPSGKDEAEKKILAILDDMDRNQRRGNMNVPIVDGRLLRFVAEAAGAKHVVEIGTSTGYSGIWFCLALRKTGGKLTTFEIDNGRATIARQNFERAGVTSLVTIVMGDAHQEVTKLKDPIDVVFIDADKPGYPDYLTKLLPLVRPGGVILAHNMTRSMADPKFLEAITTSPDLETLFFMDGGGVSMTLKKR